VGPGSAGRTDRGSHVRKHNRFQCTSGAVEGSVSFHSHDTVGYNEVDRNGCAQIDNALPNAFPVGMFFGHPYRAPGTPPNMFFMRRMTPDHWTIDAF